MPISASDQITINNIVEGLICTISSSSSDGTNLVNKEEGTILTSHIYYNNGEIDLYNQEANHNYDYYYKWDLVNVIDNNNWPKEGKSISLSKENFIQDVLIIGCSIYNADEYGAYLNQLNAQIQAEEISEPLLLGYGEIILDATIKKWMTFDDETGLWLYGNDKQTAEYFSKINNVGMHIYKYTNSVSEDKETRVAAFSTTTMVERIRIGNTMYINYTDQGGLLFTDKGEDLTELLDSEMDDKIINNGLITEYNQEENIESIERYYLDISIVNIPIEGIYYFDSENSKLKFSYKIKENIYDDNPISSNNLIFSINVIENNNSINERIISSDYYENNIEIDLSNFFQTNGNYVIKFQLLHNQILYSEHSIQIETAFEQEDGDNNDI